jgi:hypothetical protein
MYFLSGFTAPVLNSGTGCYKFETAAGNFLNGCGTVNQGGDFGVISRVTNQNEWHWTDTPSGTGISSGTSCWIQHKDTGIGTSFAEADCNYGGDGAGGYKRYISGSHAIGSEVWTLVETTNEYGTAFGNLTPGTSPVCPNGTGGALTTSGCAGAGSGAWSALTNPTTNLALTMAAYTSTFTYGATTGSSDLFRLTDTASNTGTGIMQHITTASASTEIPWQADSNGTGWKVTPTGSLASAGTTLPTQMVLTYDTGHAPSGTSGSAVIAPDTTGNLDVSENGGTLGRVCTLLNSCGHSSAPTVSSCGSGTVASGSTDLSFKITGIATTTTSCTVTFNTAVQQGFCVGNAIDADNQIQPAAEASGSSTSAAIFTLTSDATYTQTLYGKCY